MLRCVNNKPFRLTASLGSPLLREPVNATVEAVPVRHSFSFSSRIESVRVVGRCNELRFCVELRVDDELRFCVELMVCDCRCANKSVGATENKVAAEVNACEVPFAPPLLHGSLDDHGSMPLEFTDVPTEFTEVPPED